jgi:hypothetical protein
LAVERFRTAEEMNRAPIRVRSNGFERFLRHCARYWKIAPRTYPRGVVKFKSLGEAQETRAEVGKENVLRRPGGVSST